MKNYFDGMIVANPKSPILHALFLVRNMLESFKSRCTIFSLWRYSNP